MPVKEEILGRVGLEKFGVEERTLRARMAPMLSAMIWTSEEVALAVAIVFLREVVRESMVRGVDELEAFSKMSRRIY